MLDLVFKNGKVITVDPEDRVVDALGVSGNKIAFVGREEDLPDYDPDKARVVDLAGRVLMPGLIDTHYHPILGGLIGEGPEAAMIDTFPGTVGSLHEMLGLLREAVARKEPGQWISMMGYEPSYFPEGRHPTLAELDAIAPDNPVHCMHGGGHICIYNSQALKHLEGYCPEGVAGPSPDEVEVVDGRYTGMVRGHAHFWLWSKVEYTEEDQSKAAMKSHAHCLENGITSIHDAGELGRPSYHIMQKLCRRREFKVRSYMLLHSIFGKRFSAADNGSWMDLGLMTGLGDEHFRIGSCKFMIDGGSGGPSCYTREPYSHDPSMVREKGWEREEVAEYIARINAAECQATAHAIGDGAVEYMVEGYERAFAEAPRPDLRHRIEHCTLVDQDLIDRMAPMDICPSVNVGMISFQGGNYERFFGPERAKYVCAIRSMLDAGIKCSLHSDYPSGPAGLALLDSAVNRMDRTRGVQCDRTQAVSLLEAIRCATWNGAYASFEEESKGSLKAGKLADLIVLSEDILEMDPARLNEVKVDQTYIDGDLLYQRKVSR